MIYCSSSSCSYDFILFCFDIWFIIILIMGICLVLVSFCDEVFTLFQIFAEWNKNCWNKFKDYWSNLDLFHMVCFLKLRLSKLCFMMDDLVLDRKLFCTCLPFAIILDFLWRILIMTYENHRFVISFCIGSLYTSLDVATMSFNQNPANKSIKNNC